MCLFVCRFLSLFVSFLFVCVGEGGRMKEDGGRRPEQERGRRKEACGRRRQEERGRRDEEG